MGKALYSEFKSIVDQINAFRTGTLGAAAMTLTANPAAAQYAKMTAQQVNELQDQSANLSSLITTSVSSCPGLCPSHNGNVRSYNASYLNEHKNTVYPSNLRDNTTYYSNYLNSVNYFYSYNDAVYTDQRMTRYNGHYDAQYAYCSGYNDGLNSYKSDRTSHDGHNFYNSYLLTDDSTVRTYDGYNGSNYGHNSSRNNSNYSSRYGANRSPHNSVQ